MNQEEKKRGSLPAIIQNESKLYEGDLVYYFRVICQKAQNLQHPYHNFRHMFHVFYLCYQACLYYRGTLTPREMRNLLIAAMFHDFDHSGMDGDDDLNIEKAQRGIKKYILPEDRASLAEILTLIKDTEFPYSVPAETVNLSGWILRDADLSQCFSTAWIQQVIFGLAEEWGKRPIDILRMQPGFIENLKYQTDWARELFKEEVQGKKDESQELLLLLEPVPVPPA